MHVVEALWVEVLIVAIHEVVNAQVHISLTDDGRISKHQETDNKMRYQTEQHHTPCLRRQLQSIPFWLRVNSKYYIMNLRQRMYLTHELVKPVGE